MEVPSSIIETGVDKLVKLVRESGKIAVPDAARMLNVSQTIVMEWADFLEEEGIISVEYKFTKPFLVERKLTKKEVEAKAREFESRKDIFVRKSEVSLGFLERQANELKGVKEEFDRLKQKFGIELGTVRSDLNQLGDYEKQRDDLAGRIMSKKQDAEQKITELTKKILAEEKKLRAALFSIKKEKWLIEKEKVQAESIEKYEKVLLKKLDSAKKLISSLDSKMRREDESIKNSEQRMISLKSMLDSTKEMIDRERSSIEPLLKESREHEKRMSELHKSIVSKIRKNGKKSPNAGIVADKISILLKKKLAAIDLVDKVNKDRDALEKELIELIKKAKSFQLTSSSAETDKHITELEGKFRDVEEKKKVFEQEYRKLKSAVKS